MSRVLVLGTSLPALAAALECAEVGISVRIVPGPDRLPAAGVRDPQGVLAGWLEAVAEPLTEGRPMDERVLPQRVDPPRAAVRGKDGAWHLQPEPQVLGIPAVPISRDAIAVLGTGAGVRGYLDRLKPVLTIGKEHRLDHLVTTRVGQAVLDRLVTPMARERFGADPADLDVAAAAPGLNEALTRTGSLTGAVLATADRHAAEEATWLPLAGWDDARAAILERLALYGAELVAGVDGVGGVDAGDADIASFDAVIADADHPAVTAHAGGELEAVLREIQTGFAPVRRWRIRAEVAITPRDLPTLALVVDEDGSPWTIRTREISGMWIAELHGPGRAEHPGTADHDAVIARLLTAADIVPTGETRVRVTAAPYRSVAEEEIAATVLQEVEEAHLHVIICGESIHGGSVATAVGAAVESARQLRRRLTGISD